MRYNHSKLLLERLARGWTQGDVAKKARVSIATVRRFEQGRCLPRAKTAYRLAIALRLHPWELLAKEEK